MDTIVRLLAILTNSRVLAFLAFVTAAATGVILFADNLIVGLDQFKAEWKPWIGLTFLVSILTLIFLAFFWLRDKIIAYREKIRADKQKQQRMSQLSESEKHCLRHILSHDNRCAELDIGNSTVALLLSDQIIYQVPRRARLSAFSIRLVALTNWAKEMLDQNPDWLD